jgi:hypothetical protein
MMFWNWLSSLLKIDPRGYKRCLRIHPLLFDLLPRYATSLSDVTDFRGA